MPYTRCVLRLHVVERPGLSCHSPQSKGRVSGTHTFGCLMCPLRLTATCGRDKATRRFTAPSLLPAGDAAPVTAAMVRLTMAALTNCGRAPTTVRIRTVIRYSLIVSWSVFGHYTHRRLIGHPRIPPTLRLVDYAYPDGPHSTFSCLNERK